METLLSQMTLVFSGFVFGLKHAFDADHIAALTAIVCRTRSYRSSLWQAVYWGIGHTVSLLIFGSIVLVSKLAIPEGMEQILEGLVGIMLILLGINVLWGCRDHNNIHYTMAEASHSHTRKILRPGGIRSFLVGMVHGLAGSAALTLFVLASVKYFWTGILYIMIFGAGSVLGMLMFSGMISIPLLIKIKSKVLIFAIQVFSGGVSIMLGVWIVFSEIQF